MITYDELLQAANDNNINVAELAFKSSIKGLYSDNCIAINNSIDTAAEKKCILAEELGHHCTSSGDILNQSDIKNRKQERQARGWAYKTLVSIENLIRAYKNGCQNTYEIAEYLDVSEAFLRESVDYYSEKYGYYKIENYIIYFNPLTIYTYNNKK